MKQVTENICDSDAQETTQISQTTIKTQTGPNNTLGALPERARGQQSPAWLLHLRGEPACPLGLTGGQSVSVPSSTNIHFLPQNCSRTNQRLHVDFLSLSLTHRQLPMFLSLEIPYKLPHIPGIPGQVTYCPIRSLNPSLRSSALGLYLIGPFYHVYYTEHKSLQCCYYRKPAFYFKYTKQHLHVSHNNKSQMFQLENLSC